MNRGDKNTVASLKFTRKERKSINVRVVNRFPPHVGMSSEVLLVAYIQRSDLSLQARIAPNLERKGAEDLLV